MNRVIIFSPHPDDETLGCGGTILRHIEEGDEVHWVIFTKHEPESWSTEQILKREKEIDRVSKLYSFSSIIKFEYPAATLDQILTAPIIQRIQKLCDKLSASIIYLPFPGDAHSDHEVVYNSVIAASKSFRAPSIQKIICCEIISETNFNLHPNYNAFRPNYYVDITKYLESKIDIMSNYESEIGEHPFPRSSKAIEALATLRGSECGVEFAEAFMIMKEVKK